MNNRPYGKVINVVKENMFTNHPYRWSTIGSMEHLDTATLEDFKAFNKILYLNNAVLVVAGDFEKSLPRWIQKYFGQIKRQKNKISLKNQ
jgi:predicted Zn-dependent peptidase